ncbi:MAG: YdbH domain-containing protein [Gammaproteobacteria bacterium]|nr:YdbH domain-containing protein [Gammaproteobacteria bacterium]
MFMRRHWYFLLLLFVVILALLAWSARTQLTEAVITRAMSDAGLTDITADIQQLDVSECSISRLKFTLLTDTALLHLVAHNINISYQPEEIINGHIDRLSVDTLNISYQQNTSTIGESAESHEPPEPDKAIKALKHALAEYIFFNEIHVEHFMLSGSPLSKLDGKTLRLKSTVKDKSLAAEITLLNPPLGEQTRALPQIVISSLTEDSLKAELRLIDPTGINGEKLAANLELALQNSGITGRYLVKPQRLQSWLQPWLPPGGNALSDKKALAGTTDITGTVLFDLAPDKPAKDKQVLATLTAACDKLSYQEFSTGNAAIKLKIKTSADDPGKRIQILNGSYFNASDYKYGNFSLNASHIFMVGELTNSSGNWVYQGGFRSDSFAASYQSQVFKIKNINARLLSGPEILQMSGDFSPVAVSGKFTFDLDQDIAGPRPGKLTVKSLNPLDLNAENSRLSQLLAHWPYPFDLLTGNIKLTLHASWSQQADFRLTSNIQFTDVGGYFNEIVFSGLSFDHELEILPELQSIHGSTVKLEHIDSGVTASNVSAGFELESTNTGPLPRFAVEGLQGEIFGGVFSADNFVYDANSSKNHLRIKASEIDLAEIVKTQQLEDLTVTGRVSGFIPVEINENGIRVEDGAFINDIDSGTIRYNPATATAQLKQNPLTGIALEALRDFRYSYLSAGVNYTEEGNLSVKLQLKGTSPELDTKRPVHLNINTEQNLLSLLKSLRYAQGLSEKIDYKVRRIYENNQKKAVTH